MLLLRPAWLEPIIFVNGIIYCLRQSKIPRIKSPNPDSVVDFTIATCGLFRLGMFCPKTPAEFLRDLLPCYFGGDCCYYDEC
jgi:hypothetical protein